MNSKHLLIIALSTFLLSHHFIKAQNSEAFGKGTVVATIGYGFPDLNRSSLRASYNIYGYNSTTVNGIGPLILKGDYGIVKFNWGHTVGAGIVLGFSTTHIKYNYTNWGWNNQYTETDNYTTITIGARGSYHFYTKEKVDCYANIGVGFNINSNNQTTTNPNGIVNTSSVSKRPGVYEAFTVGIRYYFAKNIGVYAEAGWDMHAPVQGGIALKF